MYKHICINCPNLPCSYTYIYIYSYVYIYIHAWHYTCIIYRVLSMCDKPPITGSSAAPVSAVAQPPGSPPDWWPRSANFVSRVMNDVKITYLYEILFVKQNLMSNPTKHRIIYNTNI